MAIYNSTDKEWFKYPPITKIFTSYLVDTHDESGKVVAYPASSHKRGVTNEACKNK